MTAPTARRQAQQGFAAPVSGNSAKLTFEVVAGAHRGAVLVLDQADYRIGSSPDADIVLTDAGVAPEHAVVRVEHGAVRIGAIGGDVRVEQDVLPISRGRRIPLPASIELGAAQIRLSDTGKPPGLPERLRRLAIDTPLTAAALFAFVIFALTGIEILRSQGLTAMTGFSDADASRHSTSGLAALPPSAAAQSQTGTTADDAARELKARLDAAGISTLRVSADGGRLAVAGKLSKQQAGEWSAIQRWFDQVHGGRIVLTTAINPPEEIRAMPALQLQAVWYGERPYVVMADGGRYFQGAVLDNGWVIREIGEDRLLLAKDGQTAALTYR